MKILIFLTAALLLVLILAAAQGLVTAKRLQSLILNPLMEKGPHLAAKGVSLIRPLAAKGMAKLKSLILNLMGAKEPEEAEMQPEPPRSQKKSNRSGTK